MSEQTKRKFLIGAILLSCVPAVLLMSPPTIFDVKTIALYVSATMGYVGIVVLLWSYILGAKSVMGLVFRDLAPVLSLHKWLGKYGTLAIFIHPVLVFIGYGESWLYTIVPHTGSQFERHVTLGRIAVYILILIWVTSAVLRDRIAFRPWRYIHMLGHIALPFAFLHVPDVGTQFMTHTGVKGYYFALVVIFAGFSVLRLRGLLNLDKTPYHIVSHQKIVSDDAPIWLVQLRPKGVRLTPNYGQYVYIKDGFISEEHPFSVLDYDKATGDITIAYRTFGRFTKQLSAHLPGHTLYLGGPHGAFTKEIRGNATPVVFVAGGIGITPIVRRLMEPTAKEQWLFYANRTHRSAMILSELKQVLGNKLVPVFSREQNVADDEEIGHIRAEMFKKYLTDPINYTFYICGSAQMMHDITTQLTSLGVPPSSIHREAFSW